MLIRYLLLSIFLIFSSCCFAQNSKIDSIKKVISAAKVDSLKVNSLISLSKEFLSISPQETINYAITARDLAQKADFKSGLAYAYKNIGIAYFTLGNYVGSLENYNHSLAVFDSLKDKSGVANILSNEGAVYFDQG